MKYWVNIHHPRAVDEMRSSQCRVYIQKKSKQIPSDGDKVFIYETGALSGETVISEDENGKHEVKLERGAKGLIALVEIDGNLKKHRWIWNGTEYVGSFDTNEIDTKRKPVSLEDINKKYHEMGIARNFNPRTFTGLRILKTEAEIKALLSLKV